jgi:hypothetical protein
VVGFFFSASWSIATWQMLNGSLWALLPAGLAMLALRLCMPSEVEDDEKDEVAQPHAQVQPA